MKNDKSASYEFALPKTIIQDGIHGRIKIRPRKMGPQVVLTLEEELNLVNWLKGLAKTRFSQNKTDLQNVVQIKETKRLLKTEDT